VKKTPLIDLPKDVDFIISRLNSEGYRADIVGGPVRDFLLGNIPDDYDITTNALPTEVEEVFFDKRIVETGIKHGTVSLILNGKSYEITTYRIDGEYKDSRHPESVSFTKEIEEDLSRRDFTMNAIAYNPRDGITDPFFGREDIEKGIIRAVGDPEKRFTEDALRILRGIRFSSRLGFSIEKETRAAILSKAYLLSNVSSERIYVEWKKLLEGKHALTVFDSYRDVIKVFLPEVADSPLPDPEKFERLGYTERLLSLFLLSGAGAEDFSAAMRRLRTDNKIRELGERALSSVGKFDTKTNSGIGRILNSVGEEAARLVLSLEELVSSSCSAPWELFEKYIENCHPYRVNDLSVSGKDLSEIGAKGREIGDILSSLLFAVIDGELENKKEPLLAYARKVLSRNKNI